MNNSNNRPETTLFMIESLDGKINSGNTDALDVDRDWKTIDGVKQGLKQYYDLEQETDLYSLNSGRVMAKIGVNERTDSPEKTICSFIIIDRKPHLNENGVAFLCKWVNKLFLVTDNKNHPAYNLKEKYDNLQIMYYEDINLNTLMEDLYDKHNVDRVTIQTGGTLNCEFLRAGLIDHVNIVIAPLLVGGSDTSTLIDGKAISTVEELGKLKALKLEDCNILRKSYIQLKYKVLN